MIEFHQAAAAVYLAAGIGALLGIVLALRAHRSRRRLGSGPRCAPPRPVFRDAPSLELRALSYRPSGGPFPCGLDGGGLLVALSVAYAGGKPGCCYRDRGLPYPIFGFH